MYSFQSKVMGWMRKAFEGIVDYMNMTQRCDRFIEECLELVQACGYDLSRVAALVQYVDARPKGEVRQEVGGVMVTLAALCGAWNDQAPGEYLVNMMASGENELERINRFEVMAKIRAKQADKTRDIPFSPLPIKIVEDKNLPENVVLLSRGNPNWFFVAAKSKHANIDGAPVYETLDPIVPRREWPSPSDAVDRETCTTEQWDALIEGHEHPLRKKVANLLAHGAACFRVGNVGVGCMRSDWMRDGKWVFVSLEGVEELRALPVVLA